MPELPEVETTVRGLEPVLAGQVLSAVDIRRADLRWPIPLDLGARLLGARVVRLGRRAKYGLIDTDRGDTMIFHLGMSGRWRIDPVEIGKHDHLVLTTGAGRHAALCDPRRFGSLDIVRTESLDRYAAFAVMGPEPLGNRFNASHLREALKGRKSSIKAALLDQHVVAGLGNIYVCEALHMAHIAPGTKAGRIGTERLDRLVRAVKDVLGSAIQAGGSSLRDYARPDGQLGYFAKQWRAYGREGESCACGGTIRRRVDSGRSTFFCASCQR